MQPCCFFPFRNNNALLFLQCCVFLFLSPFCQQLLFCCCTAASLWGGSMPSFYSSSTTSVALVVFIGLLSYELKCHDTFLLLFLSFFVHICLHLCSSMLICLMLHFLSFRMQLKCGIVFVFYHICNANLFLLPFLWFFLNHSPFYVVWICLSLKHNKTLSEDWRQIGCLASISITYLVLTGSLDPRN